MVSKQLAGQALGAIANDRAANLAGRRNPEPGMVAVVGLTNIVMNRPLTLTPVVVGPLEVGPPPDVLVPAETRHDALSRRISGTACATTELSLVRHGQPLPALGAAALQHLLAVLGRHPDQKAVGPSCADGCSVETYATP